MVNIMVLYYIRLSLPENKSGKLIVTDIHDYATVFLNGNYIGKLDRREGINSIDIPSSNEEVPVLEILVEAMGHINFGKNIIDRKGITDSVTLSGTKLVNWQAYNLPMDKNISGISDPLGNHLRNPGCFLKAILFCQEEKEIYFLTLI